MLLAITLLTSLFAVSASAQTAELPRNETLYFSGQQWAPSMAGTR